MNNCVFQYKDLAKLTFQLFKFSTLSLRVYSMPHDLLIPQAKKGLKMPGDYTDCFVSGNVIIRSEIISRFSLVFNS